MARIPGTNVAAGIVPFTTDDDFATHYSQYGKGGWREVATVEERNTIPEKRRSIGMAVYVVENGKIYILKDGLTNDCWEEFKGSGTGDLSYTFEQRIADNSWVITHNLGKNPSVTVVDSSGNVVEGAVEYLNSNKVLVTFKAPFKGTAYLN